MYFWTSVKFVALLQNNVVVFSAKQDIDSKEKCLSFKKSKTCPYLLFELFPIQGGDLWIAQKILNTIEREMAKVAQDSFTYLAGFLI